MADMGRVHHHPKLQNIDPSWNKLLAGGRFATLSGGTHDVYLKILPISDTENHLLLHIRGSDYNELFVLHWNSTTTSFENIPLSEPLSPAEHIVVDLITLDTNTRALTTALKV